MINSNKGVSYAEQIRAHYEAQWRSEARSQRWSAGPIHELPDDFEVLAFPPRARRFWTYATCGMSQPQDGVRIELHLFSPVEAAEHVELMTIVAHYHRTGAPLGVGHTVNFGRPWLPTSSCEYGLISLPYLDGPALEHLNTSDGDVRFLWLVPITKSEVEFATKSGLDALERRFEEASFNYLDPMRSPVA